MRVFEAVEQAGQVELDGFGGEEESGAAVPVWECIQTYDRKKLKMKKHQR